MGSYFVKQNRKQSSLISDTGVNRPILALAPFRAPAALRDAMAMAKSSAVRSAQVWPPEMIFSITTH